MNFNTSRLSAFRIPFAAVAVLGGAGLLAAACGSNGYSSSSSTPTPSSAGANNTAASGALVMVHNDSKFGDVLETSSGMPLYTYNGDTQGKSNCTGGCLDEWPPLTTNASTAPSVSGASGTFSLVKRDDGSMQVAYNGLPLYTFTDDKPNQVTGDGEDDFKVATTATSASAAPSSTSSTASNSSLPYTGY